MRLYDNDGYREEFMELVYSLLHSDETNERANQIIDAFDMAPAVDADQLKPNDPLTLEELREMDGEPVWNDTVKKWVLVDLFGEYGERTVDAGGKWRDLNDRYYRRRPEEETV